MSKHSKHSKTSKKTTSAKSSSISSFEAIEPRMLLDSQIGVASMPFDGYLSAGVFDSGGHLVRTLYSYSAQEAGSVPLVWDGRDDLGRTVSASGTYTWKALVSQVQAVDTGGVGDSMFSPTNRWPDSGTLVEMNEQMRTVVTDADGSVYVISRVEEGPSLNKFSQDGTALWVASQGVYYGTGAAVDNSHLFVSGFGPGSTYKIYIFDTDTGALVGSPISPANLNLSAGDPTPGNQWLTVEQERLFSGIMGLASNGTRLFASNYQNNSIEVFDISNINSVTSLGSWAGGTGFKPIGITVAPNGKIWIASNGNTVKEYTYNGSASFTATGKSITGLSDPGSVDFGGTAGHLFVAEATSGHIHEYDVSGTPVLAGIQTLGTLADNGPLSDSEFTFLHGETGIYASMAVDSTGILSVVDTRRIQRFYTEGGSAGSLYQSWVGQIHFNSPAIDNFHTAQVEGATHYLHDVWNAGTGGPTMVYEVDPDWTGGPRSGWLGDGTWRVTERYNVEGYVSIPRTIWDPVAQVNREMIYSISVRQKPTDQNVIVYMLEAGGMRRAAIIGAEWQGTDRMKIADGGQYVWTDADKDGQIDWNGVGSGQDGEVNWYIAKGQTPDTNGAKPWVDEAGNIWLTDNGGNLLKVPFGGFDANGNPIYSWSSKQTIIPRDWNLGVYQSRVAPNGDIYTMGSVPVSDIGGGIAGYANYLAHYAGNGSLIAAAPPPDNINITSVAYLDEADGDPDYYFAANGAGQQHRLYMLTDDGLVVSKNSMGAASAWGTGGWNDFIYGLAASQDPNSGKVYAYVQDVMIGRQVRYRIDNLSTIQRSEGNFNWTSPADIRGHWNFDSALTDWVGTNNATFNNGTATYQAGKIGNAVSLDGTDDYLSIPWVNSNNRQAVTVSGWVKPSSVSSRNIWTYGNYHLRITSSGKLEYLTWDSVNGGQAMTGNTTLSAGSWYHVAITASAGGQAKLYVNGIEDGTALNLPGILWGGSDFIVGRSGPGFASFAGLVDDLQLYEGQLTSAQIDAMVGAGPNYDPTSAVVKVSATDATAAEASQSTGTFTITRNGSTSSALTVNYIMTGTAVNGVDYSSLTGSAVIASGQTSATVTVTPIDDSIFDIGETVNLELAFSSNYAVVPSTATVTITDNDVVNFASNPGWTGVGNTVSGNNYGYRSTSNAGGAAGEIGGTFARNDDESYYADTDLIRDYTLDDVIRASGKFTVTNPASPDGEWFVGHMSSDVNNMSMLGIQLMDNGGSSTSFRWRARVGFPGLGTGFAATNDYKTATIGNDYNFEYTYDPSGGTAKRGLLTVRVYGAGYDETNSVELGMVYGWYRYEPVFLDGFGIGIVGEWIGDSQTNTTGFYVDDVNYTGKRNGASLPTVSIDATDDQAAESPLNTGTFTITRTGSTSSALTVNYNVSGSATSGSDYSALASSVVIASGQSSATITVTPINDSTIESVETVILTLSPSANYSIGAASDTVSITSEDSGGGGGSGDFSTNPGWAASGNTANGNSYGYSSGTTYAGGTAGEIGGTFARNNTESYYADNNLSATYDLDDALTASGKLSIFGQPAANMDGEWVVGFLSTSTSDKSFVGIRFMENGTTSFRFNARMGYAGSTNGSDGSTYSPANGDYNFSISYDPSIGYGRVTVRLWNGGGYDQTAVSDLTSSDRSSGNCTFNAFGIGIRGESGDANPANYVQMYVDDVTYTGQQSASLPTVTVSATDASAAEPSDTGTFTVTRTTTTGNLVVYYTATGGTATSGSDYSALSGSVVISAGQATATVTVTPINDTTIESDETVILAISTNAGYTVGSPNNATVTIVDNDSPAGSFGSDPYWTASGNTTNGNGYGYSSGTNYAGGEAGEIGGTFARTNVETYYADSNLSQSYTLSNTITASGKLSIFGQNNMDGDWALGHMSSGTSDYSFVGIRFLENSSASVRFGARVGNAADKYGSDGGIYSLPNGDYNYTYTYDPSIGSYGRLTVRIWDGVSYDQTSISNLTSGDRSSGGTMNAFGIGSRGESGSIDSGATIQMYVDDVTYSGQQGGTEVPAVTVSASDAVAAEAGSDTGTFAISRTTTSGALTVYYTVSGTATSGSDFSALSGSVVIADGQPTAWVTMTPIDDSVDDPNETVILNISTNANYTVGAQSSATITIADNDAVVSVTASDPNAAEPSDTGAFTVSRNNTTGNLTVNYTIGGTATNGTDYSALSGWVVIADGQTSATVTVTPIDDSLTESTESVVLTVSSSVNYTIGTPASAQVNITDDENPVNATGMWTFDDTLNDAVGTNNGTFSGGTPSYVTGRIGTKAIDLDGTNDYVQMMYATDPAAYTITAWVKPTDVTSVMPFARGSSLDTQASHAIIITSGSKFQHYTFDGATKTVTGSTTISANTWYHVAIVASNSGQARLYVNGQEEGTSVSIGTLWTAGDRYRVGFNNTYLGLGFFDGLVDDVRVYEQALTATQIVQIAGYAQDGFESGTTSGGTGWGGNWAFTGNASIVTTGTPKNGTRHLMLTSNNGVATRAVSLAGATSAHLVFDWKGNSFEAGETAVVEVYNGTSWVIVLTVTQAMANNTYQHADIDLASYNVFTSSFQVRFRSLMSATNDYFYVDNLLITR